MKLAVPVADGMLAMHFGHCRQFILLDCDDTEKKVLHTKALTPPAHQPGVLPAWLHEQGVDVVLAGGMGRRAQNLFSENGIRVVTGVPAGEPEDLAVAFMRGTLSTGSNVCDH